MKSFMEEYGIVVVVAIVILALIGVAMFFRSSGSQSIRDTLAGFLNQGDLGNAVDAGQGSTSLSSAI